jgi:protein-S-isoprenylcysteine O-methyltransferase Ste14
MAHPTALAVLALTWAVYLGVHSALASLGIKSWVARRWPAALPGYRLAFNALAVGLLAVPLWLLAAWPGPLLWAWSGWARLAADGLGAAAGLGFLWSLRFYDLGEFLGLRQWRESSRALSDRERLLISPLHRFVRHPWYALGLVLLWTRPMDAALLVSALCITVYLPLGIRLEERKLELTHGEVYRRYRARVPALLPRPWRRLSRAEAEALLASYGAGAPQAE